jgi:hypothetical protein
MRMVRLLILTAILLAVVQPAIAEEILFSTGSPLAYDSPDEEAVIRLNVENTLGEDVSGSFTWTVRDRDDPGNTRSFTDRRVIFGDMEYTEFGVRPDEGHDYLVDVSFDYLDADDPGTVYHVALEGISLLPGASGAGPSGGTLESVQTKFTKGSSQGQSGAPQSGSARVSQVRSSPEDLESLAELLEAETLELSEQKEFLKDRVLQSELYASVGGLLEGAGFAPQDLSVTLGRGTASDEFGVMFVNDTAPEIRVSGEMAGNDVLFIAVESPGRLPPVYGIDGNETYRALDSQLLSEGYAVSKTRLNITPEGAAITIGYENGGLKKVANVTVRNGEPVSVVLEDPDGGLHYLFPAVVFVLTAFSAFLLYRGYLRYCRTGQGEEAGPGAGVSSTSPLELLGESHAACADGELKRAFGTAGRALRLHIALRYGGGENSTNLQTLLLLKAGCDPDYAACAEILSVCDAVVYGCAEPDAGVFAEHYRRIRSMIEEDTSGQDGDSLQLA